MLEPFYPDAYLDSTYRIDFNKLYDEGYRGLIFDIDNTLVPHGAKADKQAIDLFRRLRKAGFRCCLLSNNKQQRVKMFNDGIKAEYIFNAMKPSRRNYYAAMKKMKTNLNNTIFIGDQIFTDIWGANRTGLRTILVRPINPKEEIQIIIKRIPEKLILFFFKRYLKAGGKGKIYENSHRK
jgi:HAD superfamily phosphatase (TIGR01668 family)